MDEQRVQQPAVQTAAGQYQRYVIHIRIRLSHAGRRGHGFREGLRLDDGQAEVWSLEEVKELVAGR